MAEPGASVLPLEARFEQVGDTTVIRIPLRAEELRVEKQSFIAERVGVRRVAEAALERATESVAREELTVEQHGDYEETRQLDLTATIARPAEPVEAEGDPLRWADRMDREQEGT
jgi:stress response protein YsnF